MVVKEQFGEIVESLTGGGLRCFDCMEWPSLHVAEMTLHDTIMKVCIVAATMHCLLYGDF